MSLLNSYHGNATGYLAWIEGGVVAYEAQLRAKLITVAATAATRIVLRDGDGSGLVKAIIEVGARGTVPIPIGPDALQFKTKCHMTLTGAADVFVYG